MTNQEFKIAKAKAEIYAEMSVENRVFLFSIGKKEDEFPMDFELSWDIDNPDVKIMDSLGELMFRGYQEIQSTIDCFWMKHYNAELYHDGDIMNSFTQPAQDGICDYKQECNINDIIRDTFTKTLNESEWNGECAKDAFDARVKEQGMMNQVNKLIS